MSAASRIELLERRVKADPGSVAFASLAEEYRRAGRLGEAVEAAKSGLERHPAYALARVTLGRALHELGQLDEARGEFEAVLGFAPENLAAIRGLADICREMGDAAGTLEYLQRALALAPLDVELANAVAEAEERMLAAAPPAAAAEPVVAPVAPSEPEAPPAPVSPPAEAVPHGAVPSPEPVSFDAGEVAAAAAYPDVSDTVWSFGPPEAWPPTDAGPLAADEDLEREAVAPSAADDLEQPALRAGEGGPLADEPLGEPVAELFVLEGEQPDIPPFAQAEPSGAESAEDAGPGARDRTETLHRQEAALEHFLAEILKQRDRRAS